MHLDHFVVHVDNASIPTKLAPAIQAAGFPFDPKKGKGDKGFHATNIWIGREYFEITWLLNPSGGAWIPEWVERYNQGKRGIVCLFLRTEKLDEISKGIVDRGIPHRVERTSYKIFFGLFTIKLPWRILLLPTLPGTNMEISFIQYDPGVSERFAKYLKPNSTEKGIMGIKNAQINVPDLKEAKSLIKGIFPDAVLEEAKIVIPLDEGAIEILPSQGSERLILWAEKRSAEISAGSFQMEDVLVKTRELI